MYDALANWHTLNESLASPPPHDERMQIQDPSQVMQIFIFHPVKKLLIEK